ncbi:hypothetical protein Gotur_003306 [Gossypium turneri]
MIWKLFISPCLMLGKGEKMMVQWGQLVEPWWFRMDQACYPSTARSGRFSLLCETSLTLYPPL